MRGLHISTLIYPFSGSWISDQFMKWEKPQSFSLLQKRCDMFLLNTVPSRWLCSLNLKETLMLNKRQLRRDTGQGDRKILRYLPFFLCPCLSMCYINNEIIFKKVFPQFCVSVTGPRTGLTLAVALQEIANAFAPILKKSVIFLYKIVINHITFQDSICILIRVCRQILK